MMTRSSSLGDATCVGFRGRSDWGLWILGSTSLFFRLKFFLFFHEVPPFWADNQGMEVGEKRGGGCVIAFKYIFVGRMGEWSTFGSCFVLFFLLFFFRNRTGSCPRMTALGASYLELSVFTITQTFKDFDSSLFLALSGKTK